MTVIQPDIAASGAAAPGAATADAPDAATADALLDTLRGQLAHGAARRDATGAITVDDAAALRRALRLGLPPVVLVRALASADASLAQIAAAHHVAAARLAAVGRAAPADAILATAGSPAEQQLSVLRNGEDALLTGVASLSAGGALADRIVLDVPHRAAGAVALIRPGAAGVRVVRRSPAFGQRAAADAILELDAVAVPVAAPNVAPADVDLAALSMQELLHAAIDAGILAGFLSSAREFLLTKARPWHEAPSERAADDPHTIAVFGDAYAQLSALDLLVDEASSSLRDAEPSAGPPRPVVVARAYGLTRVGRAVNRVIGVLGASGAAGGAGLDRHWRDVRTHALRQPSVWALADGESA